MLSKDKKKEKKKTQKNKNKNEPLSIQGHHLQPCKISSTNDMLGDSYGLNHPEAPFVFLLLWLAALADEKSENVSAVLMCPEGFRSFKDRWRVMAFIPQVCVFRNHFAYLQYVWTLKSHYRSLAFSHTSHLPS